MRTIVVTNHKGGSAKTTTTVNLAAALGEAGHKVLVIDMDPQASASAWLGVPDPEVSVMDAIQGRDRLANLIYESTAPGVHLVPATPELVVVDRRMETDVALGFIRAMERLPKLWDVVLVDCPPSLGYLSIAPLTVCREALIPVEAHVLSLAGITSLVETMDRIKGHLNPHLRIGGVLACRVNRTAHTRAVVARLEERFAGEMLSTRIRESIRLAEAPSFRLPITLYAPDSAGAADYRSAAAEMFGAPKRRAWPTRRIEVASPEPAAAVPAPEPTSRVERLLGAFRGALARPAEEQPSSGDAPADGSESAPGSGSSPAPEGDQATKPPRATRSPRTSDPAPVMPGAPSATDEVLVASPAKDRR